MRHTVLQCVPRTCVVLCCTLCLLERCCERETHKILAEGSIISLLLLFPLSLLGSSSFTVFSPPFLSSFPYLLLLPIFTSPSQVSCLLYYPLPLLHSSFIVSSTSVSALLFSSPSTLGPCFFSFNISLFTFLSYSLCFLSFINLILFPSFVSLSIFSFFLIISLLPFLLYRLIFLLHCLISLIPFSILFLFPFLSYPPFLSTLIYLSVLSLLYIFSFTILCPCFLSFSVFICFRV